MWEIRENSDYPKYGRKSSMRGYRDDEDAERAEREAYDCGYDDGYKDAMKEVHYSERYSKKDRME